VTSGTPVVVVVEGLVVPVVAVVEGEVEVVGSVGASVVVAS
jgi:hypothetical protein